MKHQAFETKYTDAIEDNRAIMMLYDYIGLQYDKQGYVTGGISGRWFAEEMYYHKQMGRKIQVKINSPGGNVFEGFAMIDAIIECEADTHIVGLAASMAGTISQFGVNRSMNDFAIGMVHSPDGKDKALVDKLREQLKECLTKRSKMSSQKINKMLETTNPTWLDSSEMLDLGLVDEVIVTGKESDQAKKFLEEQKKVSQNVFNPSEILEIYSTLITEPTKKAPEMDLKNIGTALGVEADEPKILAKIQQMLADKKTAEDSLTAEKNKITELQIKVTNLETGSKELVNKRATELIEGAIKEGKAKVESKAALITFAEQNYDAAKASFEGIQAGTVHNSVAAQIEELKKLNQNASAEAESYENLAKNEPQKLVEIMEKEPDKYQKLVKAYQEKNKN